MKKITFALMAVILLSLTACEKEASASLSGSWKISSYKMNGIEMLAIMSAEEPCLAEILFTFTESNSCTMTACETSMTGTYVIADKTVTIIIDEETMTGTVDEDVLTLSSTVDYDGTPMTIELVFNRL